ncbi:MAG: DNA polymerase III subunit [Defluviitaleaceae bacterium]|nr:DNA polymerase III subunit [Defluviitaleaceae bacterium]
MLCDFSKIIGNQGVIRSIKASVARGHVSHAYIIDGGPGVGKKLLALAFAKAVMCGNASDGNPCGACASCVTIESGNHPDVAFVQATKKTLGVDDIREQVVEKTATLPYSSRHRIFIIENAHTMTIPAQNALLKTLEDGPKYVICFLLSQNTGAFLPTVLSRCVLYKIPPLSEPEVYGYLTANGISAEKAKIAAAHANGAIGRGLALAADDDFAQLRKAVLDAVAVAESRSIADIFGAAKALEAHKDRIADALDIMLLHYRDILMANNDTSKDAAKKIKHIQDARQKLNRNCNFLLTVEVLLLKLAGMAS